MGSNYIKIIWLYLRQRIPVWFHAFSLSFQYSLFRCASSACKCAFARIENERSWVYASHVKGKNPVFQCFKHKTSFLIKIVFFFSSFSSSTASVSGGSVVDERNRITCIQQHSKRWLIVSDSATAYTVFVLVLLYKLALLLQLDLTLASLGSSGVSVRCSYDVYHSLWNRISKVRHNKRKMPMKSFCVCEYTT